MQHEVGRAQRSSSLAAPCTLRNAVRDRLIAGGLLIAVLPIVLSSVPWTHATIETFLDLRPSTHVGLEACLNLLWLLLAVATFAYWIDRGSRRCNQVRGFVSLVFALALLFPVISANDDLEQWCLINDAVSSQSLTADLKGNHHPSAPPTFLVSPAALATQSAPPIHSASQFVCGPSPRASVDTPGDTTGNHSPPLA